MFCFMGVRYKEAPLAVREKVSFTDIKKISMMQELKEIGVDQSVVLATCNRSEVFFFCSDTERLSQAMECFFAAFPASDIEPYMRTGQGNDAIEYLFRVAAGLESLIIGEDQILGQVVDAVEFSRTMGYSGKELNKVARDAIACAKAVKTRYKMDGKPLSVSYAGIQQLKKYVSLRGAKVLVIGSGKTASLAITYLPECGPEQIYVCSRDKSHAERLRSSFDNVTICDYRDRYAMLAKCRIAVSATASPHLVLKKEEVLKAVEREKVSAKMVLLDLAAPRDIDEYLAGAEHIQLINLDTLQRICEGNKRERERLADQSMSFIRQSVRETEEWLRVSRVDGTIESLQERCHNIVEDSFSYLNRKLVLENREKKILKKVLNSSLQRLLREPIQELKHLSAEGEQEEYKKMIESLFRLER